MQAAGTVTVQLVDLLIPTGLAAFVVWFLESVV